jgi:NADPH2:quinone reductase
MRAWQSVERGVPGLKLGRVAEPVPGPGEMLVKVEAAALNFSDLLMIDDRYQVRPPRPFVPGQEIAGTVMMADETSQRIAVGDRIASKIPWGGFAERAVVRSDMAMRIPDGVELATAVAFPVVYTTALIALTESTRIVPGESVLVLAAAGGVGLAAVEIARHLGATVIAAASSAEKCSQAQAHGAHHAVSYGSPGWSDEVKRLTDGRGVDVIVDPVGGSLTGEAVRLLAWEGRLLIVGFASGEIAQIPANRLLLKRAAAIGVYWSHERDGPMIERATETLAQLAIDGVIRPHIGAVYRFEELPQALAALGGRATTGKVILRLPS